MSFNFPTLEELTSRMTTDVSTALPNSNPFLSKSAFAAIILGHALRFDEVYTQFQSVFNALFITTAPNDFLEAHGAVYAIGRLSATTSSGIAIADGAADSIIDQGEILTSLSGIQYEVKTTVTINNLLFGVALNLVGSLVTAVTDTPNIFATGQTILIGGATETEYNGAFVITVVDSSTFNYTISGTPSTPATGAPTANTAAAVLQLTSLDTGTDTNLASGTQLTFQNVISGVNQIAYVNIDGLGGGENEESDENYRARVLRRKQNPVANFSTSQIDACALTVNGVTRVFSQSRVPGDGDVTVYFVRDGDANILPSPSEIDTVKDAIITGKIPAGTEESQVIVAAPEGVIVDFTFNSISPDTTTMRTAITNNLQQFFTENAGVANDILQLAYDSVIFNTIDPDTGQQITDFSLANPIGEVPIESNQIGLLGDVSY